MLDCSRQLLHVIYYEIVTVTGCGYFRCDNHNYILEVTSHCSDFLWCRSLRALVQVGLEPPCPKTAGAAVLRESFGMTHVIGTLDYQLSDFHSAFFSFPDAKGVGV